MSRRASAGAARVVVAPAPVLRVECVLEEALHAHGEDERFAERVLAARITFGARGERTVGVDARLFRRRASAASVSSTPYCRQRGPGRSSFLGWRCFARAVPSGLAESGFVQGGGEPLWEETPVLKKFVGEKMSIEATSRDGRLW